MGEPRSYRSGRSVKFEKYRYERIRRTTYFSQLKSGYVPPTVLVGTVAICVPRFRALAPRFFLKGSHDSPPDLRIGRHREVGVRRRLPGRPQTSGLVRQEPLVIHSARALDRVMLPVSLRLLTLRGHCDGPIERASWPVFFGTPFGRPVKGIA